MKKNITLLLLLAMLVSVSACSAKKDIVENESTEARTATDTDYPLSGFTRLTASGVVHIVLTQGSVESVRVKECPNPNLITKVEKRGDELYIYTKSLKKNLNLRQGEEPVAYVTMKQISDVDLSGSTRLKASSLQTANLKVTISGASKLHADRLRSDNLKLTCSGASAMDVKTITFGKLNASCTGASNIAATLHGDDVKLVNSGASNVDFTIEAREMEMSNSGASKSDVRFKGRRLQTSNTGAGKVFLDVDCEELSASNSGAAKFTIEGTADKTDIQASGVSKINTSKLNKY